MCVRCVLQDSVEHCIIGVTILSQLTNEINQVGCCPLPFRSISISIYVPTEMSNMDCVFLTGGHDASPDQT